MSWSELRKGRVSQFGREYFITFVTNNRTDIFHDFDAAKLFCQQIAANQQIHNCRWLTWVLMPDHFHGLLRLESESTSLSAIVGHLKGRSAHFVNLSLGISGKLWQPGFYDRALRRENDRKAIARYIVANPLRKGIVRSVSDYSFWNSDFL